MVTHHPLAIAELEKEQIQVMRKNDAGSIVSVMPDESPRGMGINLILRSDMFGLQTTLDGITHEKVLRRNFLASKDELLGTEKSELSKINNELENLGFSMSSDDPDYMDFLTQKYHKK